MKIASATLYPKFASISRDLREHPSPSTPTSITLKVDGPDLKTYASVLSSDGRIKIHHNGPHFFATVPKGPTDILEQPKAWKQNSLLFHLINTCDALTDPLRQGFKKALLSTFKGEAAHNPAWVVRAQQ